MVDSTSFSEKQLLWAIMTILFLSIFFGVMIYLVYTAKAQTDGVFDGLYDKIYETRLLYSPLCFAYQDSNSERTFTGLIDLKKFSQQNLDKCVGLTSSTDQAIFVELIYFDSSKQRQILNLRTQNWNAKNTNTGMITNSYPVNVYDTGSGIIRFTHVK